MSDATLRGVTMQERKDSANGSGANPSLDPDAAEELAASFRPAWEVDEEQAPEGAAPATAAPAPEAPKPATSVSKSTVIGLQPTTLPEPAKPEEPAAPRVVVASVPPAPVTLESSALVEAAPSEPVAPPAPKTAPLLDTTTKASPKKPSDPIPESQKATIASSAKAGPVAVAADPFAAPAVKRTTKAIPDGTEELAALVAKRPAKNYVYVAAGLGIAIGLGLFLKFALSDDEPTPSTVSTQSPTIAPMTPPNEIPPPPPKEEVAATPAPAPETKAETKTEPKAETKKETAPTPPPPRTEPAPRTAAAVAPPRTPAAPRPPPPPPRPAGKPGTGGGSGGIVRDNPF